MAQKIKVGLSNINISFDGQVYLPYSTGLLLAYALEYYPDVKNKFQFDAPLYRKLALDDAVNHLSNSDIIFFSLSIWNTELSLRIAEEIKRENRETFIVVGGCSVPPESGIDQFLMCHPYVDLACHGEGEQVFTAILENFNNQKEIQDWSFTPSVSFRNHDTVVSTPRAPRLKDISIIPSPYLTGIFDRLMEDASDVGWIGLWETNRGCPYSCAYCEWGGEVGKGVAWGNDDRLMEEIDWFSRNKIEFVRCADANFGIKPKRDVQLIKKLAENREKFGYPQSLSVENAKNSNKATFEIQKILNDSGLSHGVSLAIQSLHTPTLEAIKRKNISNELYRELQHMFEKDGIATYSDMIIGLPEESYESFVSGIIELIERGQHNSIWYFNALILPNSEMGNPEYQEEYGIITKQIRQVSNHEKIDVETVPEVEEIIIGTNTLSTEDWRRTKVFAWQSSLLYHRKLLQIPLTIAHHCYGVGFRQLFDAFIEVDGMKMPIIKEIVDSFSSKARQIQEEGSSNYIESTRWLNMWWPADQLKFIDLVFNNQLDAFYKESTQILREVIGKDCPLIDDAVLVNKGMLKHPFQTEDIEINTTSNVLDIYHGNLVRESVEPIRGNFTYLVDRTTEVWDSWEEWAKKVVWWEHRIAKVFYPIRSSFSNLQ